MVGAFPGNMICFYWEISITAAAANGDTFNFGKVPKGFRVLGGCLESTDIDTNGSPTAAINVGDSGSASRLFSASTVGQAGTADRALAVAGQHYLYTDDTVITGTIATGPATGATGTLYLSLYGRFEGFAS
jgi:hypothetical protein